MADDLAKIIQELQQDIAQLQQRLNVAFDLIRELQQQLSVVSRKEHLEEKKAAHIVTGENLTEFGKEIKRLCKLVGKKQYDLALAIGMAPTYLSTLLNGKGKISLPSSTVKSMLRILILWEAFQSQEEVIDIARLVACTDLPLDQLSALPSTTSLDSDKASFLIKDLQNKQDDYIWQHWGQRHHVLKKFILDQTALEGLRARALKIYSHHIPNDTHLHTQLLADPSEAVLGEFAALIGKEQVITTDNVIITLLSKSPKLVAKATIEAVKTLAQKDNNRLILLAHSSRHYSWEVRLRAIRRLTASRHPAMIDLLFEFRNVGYHVSQKLIRDYLLMLHQQNLISEIDHNTSVNILESMLNNPKSLDMSNQQTAEILQLIQNTQQKEL